MANGNVLQCLFAVSFCTAFCNAFLQCLFAMPFCNGFFSQCFFCTAFLQWLFCNVFFTMYFALPFCNAFLAMPFAMPFCNAFLESFCANPFYDAFLLCLFCKPVLIFFVRIVRESMAPKNSSKCHRHGIGSFERSSKVKKIRFRPTRSFFPPFIHVSGRKPDLDRRGLSVN